MTRAYGSESNRGIRSRSLISCPVKHLFSDQQVKEMQRLLLEVQAEKERLIRSLAAGSVENIITRQGLFDCRYRLFRQECLLACKTRPTKDYTYEDIIRINFKIKGLGICDMFSQRLFSGLLSSCVSFGQSLFYNPKHLY